MTRWLVFLCVGCALPPPGVPLGIDDDGDGFPAGEDCDDDDPTRFPDAEWPVDADGDGFAGGTVLACEPPADALVGDSAGDDCDDADAAVAIPATWYADGDGDGYGGAGEAFCHPPGGAYLPIGDDCDDAHPRAYPGALEDCGPADLDCGAGPDPVCRLSGTYVLQLTGNEWYPEVGHPGPELDGDPGADALLLGDYDVQSAELTARWYDLDDAANPSAPREYSFDALLFGHSLEFATLPDLDGDGEQEVWLVHGDLDDSFTTVWDLDDVGPGTLVATDAFIVRGPPFGSLAGAVSAADLRAEPGIEVAMRALEFNDGRVEIWGDFAGAAQVLATITGQGQGYLFGVDVAATDLDGDGTADLAVSMSATDETLEGVYLFRGPFVSDRNVADADAALELPGGTPYVVGQVEPAGDLLGTGAPWLWWGAPDDGGGGRVIALPGDLATFGPTDPASVDTRRITGAGWAGLGGAMAMVGDQTGDGIADPLVGAPHWTGDITNGAFLLDSNAVAFGGAAQALDDVTAASFTSALLFGYAVSSAGEADLLPGEDVWIGADGPAFLLSGGVLR